MFKNYNTVNLVKQAFKTFVFELHPDRGGSHDAFVEMQSQYLAKLKTLNGETFRGFDNKEHKYYYNEGIETEVMQKITELLNLKANDLDIELIGVWLWVSGNTREHKEKLKELKLKWHSKRLKWYFHTKSYKRKMSKLSFDQIRLAYGSKTFRQEREEKQTVYEPLKLAV